MCTEQNSQRQRWLQALWSGSHTHIVHVWIFLQKKHKCSQRGSGREHTHLSRGKTSLADSTRMLSTHDATHDEPGWMVLWTNRWARRQQEKSTGKKKKKSCDAISIEYSELRLIATSQCGRGTTSFRSWSSFNAALLFLLWWRFLKRSSPEIFAKKNSESSIIHYFSASSDESSSLPGGKREVMQSLEERKFLFNTSSERNRKLPFRETPEQQDSTFSWVLLLSLNIRI